MKVVIAPDSFKECLSAKEVSEVIADGLKSVIVDLECVCVPVADGGEGTMNALIDATGGEIFSLNVTGPLGHPIVAEFGLLGDKRTAVVEMASASGIELIARQDRNPLITTTFGTGELIKAALDKGANKIIIAIGGSATNDGGVGMLQALGILFLNEAGHSIGFGGGELGTIAKIDVSHLDPRLKNVEVLAACDVNNPLTGEQGASVIFGPQKGATAEMVAILDINLTHYARCVREMFSVEIESVVGAGAAGGMGAGLLGFLNADLKPGIDIVLDAVGLDEKMQGAMMVITGEGKIDGQTLHGKTPVGVSRLAQKHGLKTIALAGCVGEGIETLQDAGIIACFSVVQGPCDLDSALCAGRENVFKTAQQIAAVIQHFNA